MSSSRITINYRALVRSSRPQILTLVRSMFCHRVSSETITNRARTKRNNWRAVISLQSKIEIGPKTSVASVAGPHESVSDALRFVANDLRVVRSDKTYRSQRRDNLL